LSKKTNIVFISVLTEFLVLSDFPLQENHQTINQSLSAPKLLIAGQNIYSRPKILIAGQKY
jgi:hypothetical protein